MAFIILLAITIILLFTALSRPRSQAHKKKGMNGRNKLYLDKTARRSAPLPFQQQPQGQTSKGPESGLSLAHDESQRSDQEIAEILAKRARLTIEHHNRQSNLKEVKDAWESSDLDYGQYEEPAIFERSGLRESTTRLEIDYVDRNGTRTTRQIRVKRVSFKVDMTNAAIYAFCYERQAGRTFIASRISRCVDIETGELILGIPEFLLNAYKNTTYGKLESLREEHGDELAALVYVSKIDGRSSKMEKEIIVSYLLEVAVTSGLSSDDILQDLRNEETLSKTQFHRCVGRLSRQNNFDREAFVNATKAIVYTSKSPRPSAVETLEYIEKKFRQCPSN